MLTATPFSLDSSHLVNSSSHSLSKYVVKTQVMKRKDNSLPICSRQHLYQASRPTTTPTTCQSTTTQEKKSAAIKVKWTPMLLTIFRPLRYQRTNMESVWLHVSSYTSCHHPCLKGHAIIMLLFWDMSTTSSVLRCAKRWGCSGAIAKDLECLPCSSSFYGKHLSVQSRCQSTTVGYLQVLFVCAIDSKWTKTRRIKNSLVLHHSSKLPQMLHMGFPAKELLQMPGIPCSGANRSNKTRVLLCVKGDWLV